MTILQIFSGDDHQLPSHHQKTGHFRDTETGRKPLTNTESQRKWLRQKFPLVIIDEKERKSKFKKRRNGDTPSGKNRSH